MIAIRSYAILFRDHPGWIHARGNLTMATIIGGIGVSHTPTTGLAYDTKRQRDPAWEGAQ
jgi:hypothetical protein